MTRIRVRVLPALIPIDGKQVEMQVSATHIQWRYVTDLTGEYEWEDLIAIVDLIGADGPAIELQSDGTNIQYRVVGDVTWIDLVPLVDLTGPQGATGLQGDQGIQGIQGPAGDDGIVMSIVAGAGIDVDATDPANPIVTFEKEISTDGTLAGDSDDAVPTEQAVKTYVDTTIAALPAGGGGDKNPILNPFMEIAQNPTSVAAAADGTEVCDRWIYNKIGAVVHTVSRDTDVPTLAQSGKLLRYSHRLTLTTPDNAIAASDEVVVVQKIEGVRFRNIAQIAQKVRFWVKSTLTGTTSISFRNNVPDRSCVLQFTINAADTWEEKVLDLPATPSAGTWVYDNSGAGLRVGVVLAAGSTYDAPSAGSWQTGYFHGLAGQTNFLATGNTEFRFTDFEIYPATDDPSTPRSFEEELRLCRRIRRRFTGMAANTKVFTGVSASASSAEFLIEGMRALTGVTFGGTPTLREEGVGTSGVTSMSIHNSVEGHAHIIVNCGGGLTTDRPVSLAMSGTSDYVDISGSF